MRQGKTGHFPEAVHLAVAEQVQELIPLGAQVVWLGDGEFDGITLQQTLQEAGWSYVCRTGYSLTAPYEGETGSIQSFLHPRGDLSIRCSAEVLSLDEVRASKQWDSLREQLHIRFDQWLDQLEPHLQGPAPTLATVTDTVWHLRQDLTGGLSEMIVKHAHVAELHQQQSRCLQCDRLLQAHAPVSRTVDTMVGAIELERPYFYCRPCRQGVYPLDEALGLTAGRKHLDIHKAAARMVAEVPYDEAQALFGQLTGVGLGSSERTGLGAWH